MACCRMNFTFYNILSTKRYVFRYKKTSSDFLVTQHKNKVSKVCYRSYPSWKTWPHIQWVLGGKPAEGLIRPSRASSTKFKNKWSHTSVPLFTFMECIEANLPLLFFLLLHSKSIRF